MQHLRRKPGQRREREHQPPVPTILFKLKEYYCKEKKKKVGLVLLIFFGDLLLLCHLEIQPIFYTTSLGALFNQLGG